MKTNSFLMMFVIIILFLVLSVSINAQEMFSGKRIISGTFEGRAMKYVDGEIAIKLKEGFQRESISDALLSLNASIKRDFDELGWGWIELPEGTDIIPVIEMLKRRNEVQYAEPNQILESHQTEPNDPYFKGTSPATYRYQWGLHNISQSPPAGIYDSDIDATETWDLSTGSSDVIVAILDSGIPMLNGSLSHPDLDDSNKIILGPDYVDNPNLPEGQEGVRDRMGHGTHVAGIVAAETNNSTGVAGVAWNCKLMIIQVFNSSGNGTDLTFYNGVKYAVDYKRNDPGKRVVINFSGGGNSPTSNLQAAVEYAYTYGVTIIASTGNNNSYIHWPAAYSSSYSNVIAVGATDQNDVRSSYSNYGSQINVVAPGGWGYIYEGDIYKYNAEDNRGMNIYSTTPNYAFTIQQNTDVTQNYGYMAGTSMAAPFVSGTVALMLSVNPNLTPSQIRDILQQNADDQGTAGFDYYYGHGRINSVKAVSKAYALANTNYSYTIHTAPLNFYDSNFDMTFLSSPTPGVPAGRYLVDRYFIDVTQGNFISTPQSWYTAAYGFSWANPNNANRWLEKQTTSSSVRYKTVFYFIKRVWPTGSELNIWAPFNPNAAMNREFITLGIPNVAPIISNFTQSPNPICKGTTGYVYVNLSQGNGNLTYNWFSYNTPAGVTVSFSPNSNRCTITYSSTDAIALGAEGPTWDFGCTVSNAVGESTMRYTPILSDCGGCPTLSFEQNGVLFDENPLLITSLRNPGKDVTDYYLINTPITPVNNKIKLTVHEPQTEHSWFDQISLIEARANQGENIVVNDQGQIINYSTTIPLRIMLNGQTDITSALGNMDSVTVQLNVGDVITITRLTEGVEAEGDVVLGGVEPPPPQKRLSALRMNLRKEITNQQGEQITELIPITEFFLRPNKSIISKRITNLPAGTIELQVNKPLELDYFAFVINLQTVRSRTLTLSSALHSLNGEIKGKLSSVDGNYGELRPAERIDLTFNTTTTTGNKAYILKTVGRYETDSLYLRGINKPMVTESSEEIPTEYKLFDNYPNPFNPVTVISWQSPVGSHQTLKVYDVLGNEVATLVDEYREAGKHRIEFDASKLASGVYIYKLTAGSFVSSKKMMVVK